VFISLAQSLASSLKDAEPAKAEAVLTNALSIETDFPALLIDRAQIRELQGDSRGAAADVAHFKDLTRIDLDDPAQACVSQSLLRHSRDAALAVCEKAIEGDGNDAELHMQRGYLLYVMNRESEAVVAYRTAAELDPSSQKAKYGLGKMLKDTGQAVEGDALMAAALSADPKADEGYGSSMLEVRAVD
jgi:Flp pilus assembly protein TadD